MMIKKLLLLLMYGVILIMPVNDSRIYEDIQTSFSDSYQIVLIRDNEKYYFNNDNPLYNSILFKFEDMLKGAHQMPALGVSIDELTREKMKVGVWLEFKFEYTSYNSEMPFDSLLVEVSENFYGFNVIRKYEGLYEGRCFYINLDDKSMSELYVYLLNVI